MLKQSVLLFLFFILHTEGRLQILAPWNSENGHLRPRFVVNTEPCAARIQIQCGNHTLPRVVYQKNTLIPSCKPNVTMSAKIWCHGLLNTEQWLFQPEGSVQTPSPVFRFRRHQHCGYEAHIRVASTSWVVAPDNAAARVKDSWVHTVIGPLDIQTWTYLVMVEGGGVYSIDLPHGLLPLSCQLDLRKDERNSITLALVWAIVWSASVWSSFRLQYHVLQLSLSVFLVLAIIVSAKFLAISMWMISTWCGTCVGILCWWIYLVSTRRPHFKLPEVVSNARLTWSVVVVLCVTLLITIIHATTTE